MNNERYNIALIGAGHIAKTHAKAISEIKEAKVIAVYSKDIESCREFASENKIPYVYDKYEDLLKNKEIDIVDILTPSGLHADMAIEAALAGKHVIIEKPIDISLKKADLMIKTCKESRVKLSVISQHRFDLSTNILKKSIMENKLGKLVLADAHIKWSRNQQYYDKGEWRGTWSMDGGGVLMNQGIHIIDLLLYLMGEVESTYAICDTVAHKRIEVEDVAAATIRFKNGALATISATTGAYPWLPTSLEINGTKGTGKIENDQLSFFEIEDKKYQQDISKNFNSVNQSCKDSYKHISHRNQIQDMIDAIKQDREPLVNGQEGRRALELVLAIYDSAKNNKVVYL